LARLIFPGQLISVSIPMSPPLPRFRQELAATIRLAAPLALAQLAQVAMGATDTVLLGTLGRDALAAGGLGANLFFTLMIVVAGGLIAVSILVSHARGAGSMTGSARSCVAAACWRCCRRCRRCCCCGTRIRCYWRSGSRRRWPTPSPAMTGSCSSPCRRRC